jgi:hypothetical protein
MILFAFRLYLIDVATYFPSVSSAAGTVVFAGSALLTMTLPELMLVLSERSMLFVAKTTASGWNGAYTNTDWRNCRL